MVLPRNGLRVAIVIDTLDVGGAERSLVAIASRMPDAEVAFVTCYPGDGLAADLERAGIQRVALDVDGRYAVAAVARGVARALERLKPDVVHACLFRAELACRVAVPPRVPLVGSFVNASYTSARAARLSARGRLKLDLVRAIDTATLPRCDAFVANSASVARENATALGLPTSRIEVIHRGRDGEHFRPVSSEAEREAERAALGWTTGDEVVLNVARLLDRKGHAELLHASAELMRDRPRVRLVIVGDGPERATFEGLANHLGIRSRVTFAGTRNDVERYLRCCDLFAFPSHYEGHPGALVEAMLAGCQIVASDIAPNLETVTPGVSADMFPVGDTAALTAAMARALQEPSRGSTARAEALKRFDLNAVAAAHRDFYGRVVRAHAAREAFVARPWP